MLALIGLCTATAPAATPTGAQATQARAVAFYSREIRTLRVKTWYWQRVMGVRRSPAVTRSLSDRSVERLRQLGAVWRGRERAAHLRAQKPPHRSAWLCIHRYEGSWTDPTGPYYGGLQMDISFQRAYGGWLLRRKGTANHWTPLEQMWTAEKALRARGFYPWPNTARACGLI